MKKITLLFVLFLTVCLLNAQETHISFEASEGYTLDTINGQNGWVTAPQYSQLFKVSDEQASDGTNSLKGFMDTDNVIPSNGIVPALSPEYTDLPTDTLQMSFDLYLTSAPTQRDMDDFEVFVLGQQTEEGTLLTVRIIFSQGQIAVETTDPNNPDGFVYQPAGSFDYDTFFNFRMDFDFTDDIIDYYINDNQIFSGDVFSGTEVSRFGFYTNGVDQFYVDNINIAKNLDLGVKDFTASNFTHFVDQNGFLQLSSPKSPLQNVRLYNLLGQQVVNQKLSSTSESIDLNSLNSGIYIVQAQVQGKTKSFKIVKK